MNDDSILGSILGQLGGVIKQTSQQAVKIPKDIVEGIGDQVGAKTEPPAQDNKVAQSSSVSDKGTEEFVKGLYAKSDNTQKDNLSKTAEEDEFKKQIANKPREEQKNLLELRQKLHSQYYQQLTNPRKKQEERPAEKIESEKKQEMQELEQKEKRKLPPPNIQRLRQRVEGFPGTGG